MMMIKAVAAMTALLAFASLSGCGSGGGGGSTGTLTPVDRSAPSQPAGLTAAAGSSSSIALSWTASTDDVGVAGYKIYRGSVQVALSDTVVYTDTGLAPNTNYVYTVGAYDTAGNNSTRSTPVSATTLTLPAGPADTTAPSAPSNLIATATSTTQINLTWSASTDNVGVAGYEIWRNSAKISTTTATSFSNTGLSQGTSYTYVVTAYDGAGNVSAPSGSASAITYVAAVASAPANLTAVARDGYATLSWNPVGGATSYNLYWSTTSGVTKANGTKLTGVSPPLNHSGLVNGTAYYYVVTAVNSVGESAASSPAAATPVNGAGAADPLYGDQWHLKNTGQIGASGPAGKVGEDIHAEPVWTACGTGATCRGEGVRIAVVDDGLEIFHEDLFANIATGLSYNYVTGSSDPSSAPTDTRSGHGTSVAGIVGARDLNGLGVRGVAPRANLVGYNLLKSSVFSNEADAMTRNAAAVGVCTNSWGAKDNTGNLYFSNIAWRTAINAGLATGRGGRGIVYIWAAGNGALDFLDGSCPGCLVDNSNYDGQANNRGVMAVGAVNDQGKRSSYSERGANLWVSAPGGEFCDTHTITTVDRTGGLGFNKATTAGATDYVNSNYTKCMNGTSAATPAVAGVAALVLQANPNLGWRDVRMILAQTARKNDPANLEWAVNGAGFNINPNYGFGVVDADAAVSLAKTWTNLAAEKTYTTSISTPNLTIPDNNTTGVSSTFTVGISGITKVEFVEITFSAANHPYSGDLEITLTSPAGTSSILAEAHDCANLVCTAYSSWVFGSANFLGEAAGGNWTLTVKDMFTGDIGTFQSWKLKFYGI